MHRPGRVIESAGARLHAQETGDPSGRPLLFLHGGGGTLQDFEPLIGAFASHRCVLMDSRGHGASTLGDAPLRYPRLAEDAEAVIAAFGLERPAVIGHSDGGITALHLALRGTQPLAGIAPIAANGFPPAPEILETIYRPMTAARWRETFPESVALYEKRNPEPDFDRFFAALSALWLDAGPGNYPGEAVRKIDLPALVLGGDADPLATRAETIALAEALPNADLGLVPFAGHSLPEERPDWIVPFIRAFLEKVC